MQREDTPLPFLDEAAHVMLGERVALAAGKSRMAASKRRSMALHAIFNSIPVLNRTTTGQHHALQGRDSNKAVETAHGVGGLNSTAPAHLEEQHELDKYFYKEAASSPFTPSPDAAQSVRASIAIEYANNKGTVAASSAMDAHPPSDDHGHHNAPAQHQSISRPFLKSPASLLGMDDAQASLASQANRIISVLLAIEQLIPLRPWQRKRISHAVIQEMIDVHSLLNPPLPNTSSAVQRKESTTNGNVPQLTAVLQEADTPGRRANDVAPPRYDASNAAHAAQRITPITPSSAWASVSYLTKHCGLSDSQAAETIAQHAWILALHAPQRQCNPVLECLKLLNADKEDIAEMIYRHPPLLVADAERDILSFLEYLTSNLGLSEDDSAHLIKRRPHFLDPGGKDRIAGCVAFWIGRGMTRSALCQLLLSFPDMINIDLQLIQLKVDWLMENIHNTGMEYLARSPLLLKLPLSSVVGPRIAFAKQKGLTVIGGENDVGKESIAAQNGTDSVMDGVGKIIYVDDVLAQEEDLYLSLVNATHAEYSAYEAAWQETNFKRWLVGRSAGGLAHYESLEWLDHNDVAELREEHDRHLALRELAWEQQSDREREWQMVWQEWRTKQAHREYLQLQSQRLAEKHRTTDGAGDELDAMDHGMAAFFAAAGQLSFSNIEEWITMRHTHGQRSIGLESGAMGATMVMDHRGRPLFFSNIFLPHNPALDGSMHTSPPTTLCPLGEESSSTTAMRGRSFPYQLIDMNHFAIDDGYGVDSDGSIHKAIMKMIASARNPDTTTMTTHGGDTNGSGGSDATESGSDALTDALVDFLSSCTKKVLGTGKLDAPSPASLSKEDIESRPSVERVMECSRKIVKLLHAAPGGVLTPAIINAWAKKAGYDQGTLAAAKGALGAYSTAFVLTEPNWPYYGVSPRVWQLLSSRHTPAMSQSISMIMAAFEKSLEAPGTESAHESRHHGGMMTQQDVVYAAAGDEDDDLEENKPTEDDRINSNGESIRAGQTLHNPSNPPIAWQPVAIPRKITRGAQQILLLSSALTRILQDSPNHTMQRKDVTAWWEKEKKKKVSSYKYLTYTMTSLLEQGWILRRRCGSDNFDGDGSGSVSVSGSGSGIHKAQEVQLVDMSRYIQTDV